MSPSLSPTLSLSLAWSRNCPHHRRESDTGPTSKKGENVEPGPTTRSCEKHVYTYEKGGAEEIGAPEWNVVDVVRSDEIYQLVMNAMSVSYCSIADCACGLSRSSMQCDVIVSSSVDWMMSTSHSTSVPDGRQSDLRPILPGTTESRGSHCRRYRILNLPFYSPLSVCVGVCQCVCVCVCE